MTSSNYDVVAFREMIHTAAPMDLSRLGIDRPHLRWSAVRAFIRNAVRIAIYELDSALRRILVYHRIESCWRDRGGNFAPDRTDIANAVAWYESNIGALPREPAPPYKYRPTDDDELLRLASDQTRFERNASEPERDS